MEGKKSDTNAAEYGAPQAKLRHGAPHNHTAPQHRNTIAAPEISIQAEISLASRQPKLQQSDNLDVQCNGAAVKDTPQLQHRAAYAAPTTERTVVDASNYLRHPAVPATPVPTAPRAAGIKHAIARDARDSDSSDNLSCRTARVGAVARVGPHGGQGNRLARVAGCPIENEPNISLLKPHTNLTTGNLNSRTHAATNMAQTVPRTRTTPVVQHHHPVPPHQHPAPRHSGRARSRRLRPRKAACRTPTRRARRPTRGSGCVHPPPSVRAKRTTPHVREDRHARQPGGRSKRHHPVPAPRQVPQPRPLLLPALAARRRTGRRRRRPGCRRPGRTRRRQKRQAAHSQCADGLPPARGGSVT
jgi:hypothetical protein